MVTNSVKSPKFVQINLKMFNNYVATGNPVTTTIAGSAAIHEKNNNSDMNGFAQRKQSNLSQKSHSN